MGINFHCELTNQQFTQKKLIHQKYLGNHGGRDLTNNIANDNHKDYFDSYFISIDWKNRKELPTNFKDEWWW